MLRNDGSNSSWEEQQQQYTADITHENKSWWAPLYVFYYMLGLCLKLLLLFLNIRLLIKYLLQPFDIDNHYVSLHTTNESTDQLVSISFCKNIHILPQHFTNILIVTEYCENHDKTNKGVITLGKIPLYCVVK